MECLINRYITCLNKSSDTMGYNYLSWKEENKTNSSKVLQNKQYWFYQTELFFIS